MGLVPRGSIHRRLTGATLSILILFLGLTGYLLHVAQRHSLEAAVEAQLLGHVYALLGEASEDSQGWVRLPEKVADPRLNRPDSGLYAQLTGAGGRVLWNSASLLDKRLPAVADIPIGEHRFFQDQWAYRLYYGIEWENLAGRVNRYRLVVSLGRNVVDERADIFRTRLWGGLIGVGILLLAVQGLVLRWGLRPLRQAAEELKVIEEWGGIGLRGDYPQELLPLTGNINSLLEYNRIQRERYRNSLDDLAHSIKTPLALLQGALDSDDPGLLREAARQAVPHIDDILRGRLQRAALGGRSALAKRVAVAALAQRLLNTLAKVYRERELHFENRLPAALHIPSDENDFMELLGNLLDNACKYAVSRVQIGVVEGLTTEWGIAIEDDGPGIAEQDIAQVLARGGRLDERHAGQGIGLAAAQAIIRLYRGRLAISRSRELGGACIEIRLPLKP
ncbi:MAG: histidine kinase [Gammaproteobacteria bacterium]|nr:histidine kinase [Gammaproteobacteria bacterium]MBU1653513.1 histidine kinase [Gammaproteobacteria bacterium]MBU1961861.1 histidine kinase [Gammaproteobacteria bacterium]